MFELTIATKKQLEKAIAKAKAEKPLIREVELGIYKVLSSDGATYYTTAIEPDPLGGYRTCCTCPTQGHACKHLAAVFSHYLMKVAQAEAVRAELAAALAATTITPTTEVTPVAICKDCPAPATSTEGRCDACQVAKDRADLFS